MEHVKMLTEANAAALDAKMDLQIESQRERVKHLRTEVGERLAALVSKAEQVRVDTLFTDNGRGYPLGAFGSTAEDIDGLLAALYKEQEALEGMERSREETHRLSERFAGPINDLLSQSESGEAQAHAGGPILMGGGYL